MCQKVMSVMEYKEDKGVLGKGCINLQLLYVGEVG